MTVFDIEKVEIEVESQMPLIPVEPDDYLLKYNIKVTYPSDINKPASEQKIIIAFARVIVMDSLCFEDVSLFEASDAHSQETLDLYEIFFDKESVFHKNLFNNFKEIWYLERFVIEPQFQNMGLGTAIINWMSRFLCRCKGTLVVRPRPLKINEIRDDRISIEAKDSPDLQRMLVSFYDRQGFAKLLNTPYMYKIINP